MGASDGSDADDTVASDWDPSAIPDAMFDLSDSVAVVVGGTGGLGRPTALGLAEFGADVVVTSRSEDQLEAVKAEIAETGSDAAAIPMDVTEEAEVVAMVESVVEEFGRIDVLVNYAGINTPQPAEEYSLDDWNTVMGVKATGTFLVDREVGKVMIDQGGGHIVNVSSVRGSFGFPQDYLGYCAANGAVDMITKQLACEWGEHGVNVNAIAPTVVETPLTRHLMDDEERAEKLRRAIPLDRWGQPEDLIGAVVFLGSDASQFVTGQILYVDGGTTTFDTID